MTPTITIPRAIVEQALEALLELLPDERDPNCDGYDARDVRQWRATAAALRTALAQQQAEPVQEPVAWMVEGSLYASKEVAQKMGGNAYTLQALYTAPQQAEPVQPVAWAEDIINDLHALHDTEMIQEIDSGAALIRLNDAIAVVEDAKQKAALAQAEPVQEPVGYLPAYELNRLHLGHDGRLRSAKFGPSALDGDVALYTAPPQQAEPVQRKPLTEDEIEALFKGVDSMDKGRFAIVRGFARAIERAHGIKEAK